MRQQTETARQLDSQTQTVILAAHYTTPVWSTDLNKLSSTYWESINVINESFVFNIRTYFGRNALILNIVLTHNYFKLTHLATVFSGDKNKLN